MKIYIDLLFFLNVTLDFSILMTVSILIKRNIKIKRIILGSIIGGISTFTLFINVSTYSLFILKLLLGIIMCIVTFSYKNIKYTLNNLFYLLTVSFILGGGLTLLKDYGFYNYFTLIIGFIIILYFYLQNMKKLKDNYSNYYKVDVYIKDEVYNLNGYLDTGNNLYDMFNHPVILTSKNIKYNDEDLVYVPYKALNNESIVKCLRAKKIVINNIEFNNYLIGLSTSKFEIDGIDCILHNKMKGRL